MYRSHGAIRWSMWLIVIIDSHARVIGMLTSRTHDYRGSHSLGNKGVVDELGIIPAKELHIFFCDLKRWKRNSRDSEFRLLG